MLQLLHPNIVMVVWRELFEAVLIVGIVYAVLVKQVAVAVARRLTAAGVTLGIGLSLLAGLSLRGAQQWLAGDALEIFQIAVLIGCAGLMTHMCLWMRRHAPTLRRELEGSLIEAMTRRGQLAVVGLIALAIGREGLELVVFFLGMALGAGDLATTAVSGIAGAVLTVVSAGALIRGVRLFRPRWFFRITGAFLLLTAASLLLAATQRGIQAGLLPPLVEPIWDSSRWLDDGQQPGRLLAALIGYQSQPALISVLVYIGYWSVYLLLTRRERAPALAANTGRKATGAIATVVAAAAVVATPTRADDQPKLRLSGYGDLQFAYHDYGANRTLKHGAPRDARLVFDATRFVAKLEGFYLPQAVEFEAELEFEHGGSGAATELEYEESGEYETEVEKGGEVLLEEFYLKKVVSPSLVVAAGRIKVAFGQLSLYSTPADYLAVRRSETESTIIPESWNEMGAEAVYEATDFKLQAQLVNGLDSTGFSSQRWIGAGQQGRFEEIRATDLAGVVRADLLTLPGSVVGASGYYGGTTRNRPQADLVKACGKVDETQVAPCGYVDAPVTLLDVHAAVALTALRGSGAVIWGRLVRAGKVSERNGRLANALGAPRSAVADEAYGAWAEVGYDVAPWVGLAAADRLEPFVRIEQYDSMYKTTSGQIDNPRFARRVVTVGATRTTAHALFVKGDVSRRSFGTPTLRAETTLALGLGFIY